MIQLVKYKHTHCYYIQGKKATLLVDTDWAGTLSSFYQTIKALHIQKIDYLLITHYHPDHMGIAQHIIDRGATLILMDVQKDYVHVADAIFYKEQHTDFKPIDTTPIVLSCEASREFLKQTLGIEGKIIHTPGHSEDSISLILDEGIAIVGDLMDFHLATMSKNPVIQESWKNIFSHPIRKICYGHYEQSISNTEDKKEK